jgi:hypothetical protein
MYFLKSNIYSIYYIYSRHIIFQYSKITNFISADRTDVDHGYSQFVEQNDQTPKLSANASLRV